MRLLAFNPIYRSSCHITSAGENRDQIPNLLSMNFWIVNFWTVNLWILDNTEPGGVLVYVSTG